MRLFVLISNIALAAALTETEVGLIEEYKDTYGGDCDGLQFVDNGDSYQMTANGVPNHPVYKTNPNNVQEKSYSNTIPKNPSIATSQSCLPMGEIGFALNGVPFYNPLSDPDSNAVQGTGAEAFDGCGGHPTRFGQYHYHELPSLDCIFHDKSVNGLPNNGNGTLMGVARDGFPIYYWEGKTDADLNLDECHGTTNLGGTYRYYITNTFPYILGCYKGTVSSNVIVSCPSFSGDTEEMCACAMGHSASILTFGEITDPTNAQCRYTYNCDTPISTDLWCHTTEISPENCDFDHGNPCD